MIEVTLVDFFSFFYRASLVSFTQQLYVKSETTEITGILFNLYRSYFYILKNFKNVVLCIDGRLAKSFRKSQYSKYKQNREILRQQYQKLDIYKWKDIFMKTVPYYYSINDVYEGDDTIASLTKHLVERNVKVNILTVDTDLWQLTDFSRICVFDLKHKYRYVDSDYFSERFVGLKYPQLVPVYKVLFGDASDNIPRTLKPKLRKKPIIEQLNKLYEKSQVKSQETLLLEFYESEKEKFTVSRDELLMFLSLVTVRSNITVNVDYFSGSEEEYEQVCKKYQFKKVPTYTEYEYMISRNSPSVKNIFKITNSDSVDELL